MIQQARRRQDERAGTNRRHSPHPRCDRMHPLDEGRVILADLLEIYATRHDQSIQSVLYVIPTLGRDDLDSAMRPDRSRRGGQDNKLVAGLVGSPEPWQRKVREVEDVQWSAHIADFTIRVDQESDPAGPGDLLR